VVAGRITSPDVRVFCVVSKNAYRGKMGALRSRLHVWINDLGKAYIEVEKYYESGAAEFLVDDPGLEETYDDEETEENFRRNLERDRRIAA
jgi:hypothetical protein